MTEYKIGDYVTGVVTGIEKYGIFLSLDGNSEYTGLIHISEISSSFVRNISDYAELNESIKARIIDIDDNSKKLRLSVKGLDYRDSSKYSNSIQETKSGFSNLKNSLEGWILSKEKQI